MHFKLNILKTFKKDLTKIHFSNEHYSKYVVYLGRLLENSPLPPEAKDHQLKGVWNDTREFHISGDLLVIYQITNDTIKLIRIGSHSQLFN